MNSPATYTDADFDRLSWHDCHIWAIEFRPGDPERGDWTSDLAFDIDFIVEWICGVGGQAQFRVAPATLIFHAVTDPRIDIDFGRSDFRQIVHPISIGDITRQPIEGRQGQAGRPYYVWRIALNWPGDGEIAFGAEGFTQRLRAEAVVTSQQCLSLKERRRLAIQ